MRLDAKTGGSVMKSRTNKNIDVITHTCARARGVHTLVSVAANDKEAKGSTVGTFILLGRRRAGHRRSKRERPPASALGISPGRESDIQAR